MCERGQKLGIAMSETYNVHYRGKQGTLYSIQWFGHTQHNTRDTLNCNMGERKKTGAVNEQTEFLINLLMHTNPNCFRKLKAVWLTHLGMCLTERQTGCWISSVLDLQPAIRGGQMKVAIHFL